MRKKKSAMVLLAGTHGGMREIVDHRFDKDEWPISVTVAANQHADLWFAYLSSEAQARGWSSGGTKQLDAEENSGSYSVHTTAGAEYSELAIVWERKRKGPLLLRARVIGSLPLSEAQELIDLATTKCRTGTTQPFYLRGQLEYEGLPWRGELWLDGTLRLGAPSRQDETVLISPRVVLVDVVVNGINRSNAASAFALLRREVSAFLSVILRVNVREPQWGQRAWTFTDSTKPGESEIRALGYLEPVVPDALPAQGTLPSVQWALVSRPDFSDRGIWPDDREERVPWDIAELWQCYMTLDAERRQRFLQVASMWQLARSLGSAHQTTAYALKVAAVEALKGPNKANRNCNVYDVVEGLLGSTIADRLRNEGLAPQEVRNAHLHGAELVGSEFIQRVMMSSYDDPSFDNSHRVLSIVARAAIIEWLRRGGTFDMSPHREAKA